jgi:diguanylate cyclase (GGDEF)-like protein
MSLNKKVFFLIVIFFSIASLVFFYLSQKLLLDNFAQFEKQAIETQVKIAEDQKEDQFLELENLSKDWTRWNELYTYMLVPDKKLTDQYASDEALNTFNFNFVILMDTQGKILFEKGINPEHQNFTPTVLLRDYIKSDVPLSTLKNPLQSQEGLISSSDTILLVVSRAIMDATTNVPPRGVLVMGRFLDTNKLANSFPKEESIWLLPVTSPALSQQNLLSFSKTLSKDQTTTSSTNDFILSGKRFKGAVGEDLVLIIRNSREIYGQGQFLLNLFTTIMVLISLFLILSISILIDKTILSRINHLRSEINKIGVENNLSLRVNLTGSDELTDLARSVNQTLTALQQSEERMRHDSLHDPLTTLPNRNYFMDQLRRSLERAHRHHDYLAAVLFIDVDRFKIINDSLGHSGGDSVLVEIASRLQKCLRAGDIIARFGGDEFAILLDDIKNPSESIRIANRLQEDLTRSIMVDSQEIFTSVSIGITLTSTDLGSPDDLLRDAATAMNQAKTKGRARHQIFDMDMHARSLSLLQLESDMRRALERQEFRLYYQPIISLTQDKIIGFEALLRWQNPNRGMVSPGDFIPVAEETGLIVPIGNWVLHQACQECARWQNTGMVGLTVSVNISARQIFDQDLPSIVQQALETSGLPGNKLHLEITESTAMRDITTTALVLHAIRQMGVQISIDDFGTSYSALGYLKRFPVDRLKIDRSFIQDITHKLDDAALVTAIIAIGRILELVIVAEGVETRGQLEFLIAQGCDEIQGYYFSKPLPPENLHTLFTL